MARATPSRQLQPILNAAKRWIERSLVDDQSTFTDERFWTLQNVDELKRAFVENLDEGAGSFSEKLSRQLSDSPAPARRLMAEMRWILGLFPTTAAPETKRAEFLAAWQFSGATLSNNHELLADDVLEGIGSAGTAYNTHRWRELRYLILLVRDLKQKPIEERRRIFGSYDAFTAWIGAVPRDGSRQFRHMLRYFAFPDRVERISSNRERRRVLRGCGVGGRELEDLDDVALDAQLSALRKRLEAEHPEQPIDFYEPPIRELWDKPQTIEEAPAEYEVPGTPRLWLIGTGRGGSMWPQFRDGSFVAIDSGGLGDLRKFTSQDAIFDALKARTAANEPAPVNDAKACWQFSRDIAAGDIVIAKEGQYRIYAIGEVAGNYQHLESTEYGDRIPVRWIKTGEWTSTEHLPQKTLTELTNPSYRRALEESVGGFAADHSAKPVAQAPASSRATQAPAYGIQDALAELFISAEKLTDILNQLRRKKNLVLQGPPGVGKTFAARRVAYALLGAKDDSRLEIVQFHPSSSYEDFVYGWRPDGRNGFAPTPGIFHRFVEKAKARPDQPFVFLIDEINRGNLSKVLGELMMLIEGDKRGPEFGVRLAHGAGDSDRFYLPKNLFLLGTMNTADRSLALVDYALRRRFAFIALEPNFGDRFRAQLVSLRGEPPLVEKICARVNALNDVIKQDTRSLGAGYQIGHSFFCPAEPVADFPTWYRDVVNAEILPLLMEYWMDDPKKAQAEVAKLLAD